MLNSTIAAIMMPKCVTKNDSKGNVTMVGKDDSTVRDRRCLSHEYPGMVEHHEKIMEDSCHSKEKKPRPPKEKAHTHNMNNNNPSIWAGPSTTTPLVPARTTPQATAQAVVAHLPREDASTVSGGEARYWSHHFGLPTASTQKQYAHVQLQTSAAAVVSQVSFAPFGTVGGKSPTLAVAGGPRVGLYGTSAESALTRALATGHKANNNSNGNNNERITTLSSPDRQISTAGALALTAAYRSDGRLLAIGTAQGAVLVADVKSRAILTTLGNKQSNDAPTRTIAWCRDGQRLVSGSDDGVVRLWALRSNQPLAQATILRGHGDAVRAIAVWEASLRTQGRFPYDGLVFSGSLDGTVRVWKLNDAGEEAKGETENGDPCLAIMTHGDPVQSLLVLYASGNAGVPCWLLSAGGTTVKVWNPLSGACIQTIDARHRQTITSLIAMPRFSPNENEEKSENESTPQQLRILTAGLDGLVRIHGWNAVTGRLQAHWHGTNVGVAITALAADRAGHCLALGTVDGRVWVRQWRRRKTARKRQRQAPSAGTYAFFQRGMDTSPLSGDYVVTANEGNKRRKTLRKYDVALKEFRYGDALDEALLTRDPKVVMSVLEELGRRRGLTISLSNRDEDSLEPVLAFVAKYITRPRYSALLVGVADKLLDIYSPVAGQSEVIDELFTKLKEQITHECAVHQNLLVLQGQVEAILASVEDEEYYAT